MSAYLLGVIAVDFLHSATSGVQRRVLKAGQIVFNTRRSSIDCAVEIDKR
jgi:hypothetical protein